jgi:hypothetical protein
MMYHKTCSLLTLPVAAYKNQVETAGSFSNSGASLLPALHSQHKNCTNEGFRKSGPKMYK